MPVNSAIAADSRTIKLEVEQVVRIEPEGRSILTQRSFSKEEKADCKRNQTTCARIPIFKVMPCQNCAALEVTEQQAWLCCRLFDADSMLR